MKDKARYIKENYFTIILVLLMALVSETTLTIHDLGQKVLWVLIACVGLFIFFFHRKENRQTKIFKISFLGYLPFAFAFIYTLILSLFKVNSGMGVVTQAFTTSMYAAVDMIVVGTLIYLYKEKAVNIVYYVVTLSFALTLILTAYRYGILELFTFLIGKSQYVEILERHDIGVAVVALILYYLYDIIYNHNDKKLFVKVIILFAIMIMCGKRSAYMGLAAGVLCLGVLKLGARKRIKIAIGLLAVTLIGSFIYVCAIRYNWIGAIFDFLGLDSFRLTTGRLYVWTWFNDQYNVSPIYFGKGFQYIHRYMMLEMGEGGVQFSLVNNFQYLHNSILQIFIELGFWGWLIWYGFFLGAYPYVLRKHLGKKSFVFYVIIMIMMIVTYLTDNTLTYPVFQIVCFTTIFGMAVHSKSPIAEREEQLKYES